MYFRKNMNKGQVESNYKSLLAEHDKRSPHRYLTSTFHPENGDIIIDVGAAEGISALNNIEKAKKIFREEKNLKINLCTYSKQKDGELFNELLRKNNFEIEFSKEFMLSVYPSESEEPYLRRGLIRAQKIYN